MAIWSRRPGELVTRSEVQAELGGAIQGGILSLTRSPYVLVYSDPTEGRKYGYNRDGWRQDGGFDYTGAGAHRDGDQVLKRGNRAIAEHVSDGNALLLFEYTGREGNGGKLHRYVGEFAVDTSVPYSYVDDTARDGTSRKVFVFHLRPTSPSAVDDKAVKVDELVGVNDPDQVGAGPTLISPEGGAGGAFDRPAVAAGSGTRAEAALVDRFRAWLKAANHETARYRIPLPGEAGSLLTDTVDTTDWTLYEVKSCASRHYVRTALGQLFDYRRFLAQISAVGVVLPERPADDLVDLLRSLGVGLVVEESAGFVALTQAVHAAPASETEHS